MSGKKVRSGLWIDPRTKIVLLLLCVLAAAMAPSLFYEILLVGLVAVFGRKNSLCSYRHDCVYVFLLSDTCNYAASWFSASHVGGIFRIGT